MPRVDLSIDLKLPDVVVRRVEGAVSTPVVVMYDIAMFHRTVRNVALALLFGAVCVLAPLPPAAAQGRGGLVSFERSTLGIVTGTATHRFDIELARSRRQHAQGLMYRRRMARDAGMLFIYARPAVQTMWMKNTLIPLDMLFIAADGRIVSIAQRTVPLSLATISSGAPVTGVLEVNGGTVSRLKISVGDRVVHPAFQSSR